VAVRKKEQQPVVLDDPAAIKALAHPARLAVINELYSGGRELTATECGELVGLSASAMSYHLRALEKLGIVRRAEPTGDGRERPWRAAGSGVTVTAGASRLANAATAVIATSVTERVGRQFGAWLQRSEDDDPRWRDVSGVASAALWLTVEEAEQVERELHAVLDRIPRRGKDDRPPAARRVSIDLFLFPLGDPGAAD
jgi:DNA-binding transcriptional ArsR family regulator